MDPGTIALLSSALAAGGGALTNAFSGNKDQFKKVKTLGPYQEDFLKDYYQGGGFENQQPYQSGLQKLLSILGGDTSAFEAPLMQKFQQEIAPGIAERFAGLGTGSGALSSSGLNQALAGAGRNLATDLGGIRANLMTSLLPQLYQYLAGPQQQKLAGLSQRPYEVAHMPRQSGFGDSLLQLAPQLFTTGLQQMGNQRGGAGGGGFTPDPGGLGYHGGGYYA